MVLLSHLTLRLSQNHFGFVFKIHLESERFPSCPRPQLSCHHRLTLGGWEGHLKRPPCSSLSPHKPPAHHSQNGPSKAAAGECLMGQPSAPPAQWGPALSPSVPWLSLPHSVHGGPRRCWNTRAAGPSCLSWPLCSTDPRRPSRVPLGAVSSSQTP